MKIVSLVDDISNDPNFACSHGVSLYIETKKHKIIYDVCQNDLFVENAKKKNIKLEEIDFAFISHGHYDHGGGLSHFFSINSKAPVYIHEGFFTPHYNAMPNGTPPRYIGVDQELKDKYKDRFVYTPESIQVDDEIFIFSNPKEHNLMAESNNTLMMQVGATNKDLELDNFNHEHNLILTIHDSNKKVLVCGCSHRGIVNILSSAEEYAKGPIDFVVGGFHLMNPRLKTLESVDKVNKIADELLKREKTIYYTCHCTGIDAFKVLNEKLKDRIKYFSVGMELQV